MKFWPAFLGGSPPPDARETDAAVTWERETYLAQRRSTRRAWACALFAASMAVLALLSLILVLPLKEFAPYVVTVDKNTGWLEVTRGLHQGNLTQNEAITIAQIVRCVVARESFDATDYPTLYHEASLCMNGRALDAYRAEHDQANKKSPAAVYGYEGIVRVEIGSVNLLTATTALVSFRTVVEHQQRSVVNHWRSALTFGYSDKEFSMRDRFINPLGFQISSYRRDPDLSPTQE